MNFGDFKIKIQASIPVGTVRDNPVGGMPTIISVSDSAITYMRGSSRISVSFKDPYDAYSKFLGRRVTSSELKKFRSSVFGSAENLADILRESLLRNDVYVVSAYWNHLSSAIIETIRMRKMYPHTKERKKLALEYVYQAILDSRA